MILSNVPVVARTKDAQSLSADSHAFCAVRGSGGWFRNAPGDEGTKVDKSATTTVRFFSARSFARVSM